MKIDLFNEEAIIGGVLKAPSLNLHKCMDIDPSLFSYPEAAIAFTAIKVFYSKGWTITIDTVRKYIEDSGAANAIPIGFFENLQTINPDTFDFFLARFRKFALQNFLKSKATALLQKVENALPEEVQQLQAEFVNTVGSQSFDEQDDLYTGKKISKMFLNNYNETLEKIEKGIALSPPFFIEDINQQLGGFEKGRSTIVAARPGMGKTALALKDAWVAAKKGEAVAFFCMEMTALQLTARLFAIETGISAIEYKQGKLDGQSIKALMAFLKVMESVKFVLVCVPNLNWKSIDIRIAKINKKLFLLDRVYTDYLQLMSNPLDKYSTQNALVSENSRGVKVMAMKYDVAFILLSQLSREVEKRPNKRPMLSDLRDSGAIEQDADTIIFLYRPEYYNIFEDENGDSTAGICEFIVAKGRDTGIFTAKMFFQAETVSFKSISERPEGFLGNINKDSLANSIDFQDMILDLEKLENL
jgi:replicative DNA helicase